MMNMNSSEDYFNIKLVREVEKYPLLYNFNVAEYSKRDACDESWEKVAKAMNDTGELKTIISIHTYAKYRRQNFFLFFYM